MPAISQGKMMKLFLEQLNRQTRMPWGIIHFFRNTIEVEVEEELIANKRNNKDPNLLLNVKIY